MPAPGDGVGCGAERGVDHGTALPGHGGAARASAFRGLRGEGGNARGAMRRVAVLEEITETSGLDLGEKEGRASRIANCYVCTKSFA